MNHIFKAFNDLKVVVVGDVMLDSYLWGTVERISPEAPVPIVSTTKRERRLGGAANVALNLKSLGAQPIICSVIGDDVDGANFLLALQENEIRSNGVLKDRSRQTTVKTRILSRRQQILRVDFETVEPISKELEDGLIEKFLKLTSDKIDVAILQDYNKGVLTERVITEILSICKEKGIKTVVDPKSENFFAYKNADLFKPNFREITEALNTTVDPKDLNALEDLCNTLREKINNKISLLTLSENGVYIATDENQHLVSAHYRDIADVSGAGDTVLSVAALCLAMDLELKVIAELSNLAGGLVCEEVGVVPINKNKLLQEAEMLGSFQRLPDM